MKVGLVDDQVLFLHGIAQIISSQPDMDVIWQANDGEDALTQCAATPADVVLMDVQMPVRDGISATAEIASTLPETKVIILTTFDDEDYVVAGLRAGASGFVLGRRARGATKRVAHCLSRRRGNLTPRH